MDREATRSENARRLIEAIRHQLGSDICYRLDDPNVTEILLNPDGIVWEDRCGIGLRQICTMRPAVAEAFISTIAATMRAVVTREKPLLQCILPIRGARFEAVMPPVVSAPVFSIRLKASRIYTFDDYEAAEIMTPGQRRVIEEAVQDRKNIIVSGGTGSGKTTLTNAALAYMSDVAVDDRVVILEDTVELQCAMKNAVAMCATEDVSLTRLLKTTLRLRPDRIIVGEIRGGEARDMLKAWNTGHPGGICTLHANNARAALVRIEQLVDEVARPNQAVIAEAVDLIVSIAKVGLDRRVQEVVEVHGFKNGEYVISTLET